jgi:DNA-directed RNA polymerase beta subunit
MANTFSGRKRIRKSFGRISEVAPMPNLIEVQKSSYDHFLQMDVAPTERGDVGLQEVFKSVFPISDFSDRARLEFVRYELEQPKYDVEECQQRGMTFAAPLKVTLRLVVWDVDEDSGLRSIRDIKEQDVYMGDMPLMTDNGTFIVNGTERVIVSQATGRPASFDHDKGKTHSSGKYLFAARASPTAAPGSTSSSMPRTTSMSASTAAASCRRRRCYWRSTAGHPRPAHRAGQDHHGLLPAKPSACRRRRCWAPSTARCRSPARPAAGRPRSTPSACAASS